MTRSVGEPEDEEQRPDPASDPAQWSTGRLLSTAARLVERDWNAWLAGHEVTHAGVIALHALHEGPLTQRQLAAASRVEEQTMSRVLDRLERTGYVTRDRDPHDRRRMVVTSTARGAQVFETIQGSDVSTRMVTDHVRDPERFRAELLRLVEGLGESPR